MYKGFMALIAHMGNIHTPYTNLWKAIIEKVDFFLTLEKNVTLYLIKL